LVASLALALVMNLPAKGIGVFRTLIYLPSLAPPVAATLVFVLLLDSNNGLVNVALSRIGVQGPAWLFDQNWTKPALIMMSLWGIGTGAMIFLAGLQEIPQAMVEAAMVDGAGPVQRFQRITLPLLSPVILFNLVMGIIASFQVFSQALVVGGPTGSPVGSTLMLMVLIYRTAFNNFQMGYAAAQSVFLFLVIVVLAVIVFRVSRRFVYYENSNRAA
jgi:multiple sugar transport system permease protein